MQLLSWLCLLSFLQLLKKFETLVMLLLIARLVWAVLEMHSVSFVIAPSIFSNSNAV